MSRDTPIRVTPCPNGPLLVRGATQVDGLDGRTHEVRRPVVAICVCGKSQREPWCDDTHRVLSDEFWENGARA